MALFTMEIGKMISNMDKESKNETMVLNILVISFLDKRTGKELSHGQKDQSILEKSRIITWTEREPINGGMEESIRGIG